MLHSLQQAAQIDPIAGARGPLPTWRRSTFPAFEDQLLPTVCGGGAGEAIQVPDWQIRNNSTVHLERPHSL